jgi:hypothetical protein
MSRWPVLAEIGTELLFLTRINPYRGSIASRAVAVPVTGFGGLAITVHLIPVTSFGGFGIAIHLIPVTVFG